MKIIRPATIPDSAFSRASTATYFDSSGVMQTADIDEPRLNYDPSDLTKAPSILVEAAATNNVLWAEQLNNAAWNPVQVAITVNTGVAPDGASSADTITTTTGITDAYLEQAKTTSSSMVFSVHVKQGSVDSVCLRCVTFRSAQFSDDQLYFNFSTRTFTGAISGNFTSYGYVDCGRGWVRLYAVKALQPGQTSSVIRFRAGGVVAGTGETASVWGAQLEPGTFPTSYIPTTSAPVTRAADISSGTISNVPETDYTPYSASQVYSAGTVVRYVTSSLHKLYQSLSGSTSVVTTSIASPCVVSWTANGLTANTPVSFSTTGVLPTGLVAGTVYYVLSPSTNTFSVSATPGGAAINTTGTQSGVHTATASINYAQQPDISPSVWLDIGPTNRWKMFDNTTTSQTSNADVLLVSTIAQGRNDSVALLGCSATSATVTMTDATDGVVYTATQSFISDNGIQDWFAYFFEPIERKTDMAFTDLPPYANATIGVTLVDTGKTVLCGSCVIGQKKDVGDTEVGVKTGIQDYSVKSQDAFGNYTITQRAFRKTLNFTIWMDPAEVDPLQRLLQQYRATPTVYIASDDYESTLVYGFYKDFSIDIAYPNKSVCTLQLEGIT